MGNAMLRSVPILFVCALASGSAFVERPRLANDATRDDGWEESEVKFPGEDAALTMCASMNNGKVTAEATKCSTQCIVIKQPDKGITSMCDPNSVCSHPGLLVPGHPKPKLPAIANGKCIEYCTTPKDCAQMYCTQSWLGADSTFPSSSCTKVK